MLFTPPVNLEVSYSKFALFISMIFVCTIDDVNAADTNLLGNISSYSNESAAHRPELADLLKKTFTYIIYTFIILSCLIGNMLVIIAVVIVKKLHTQDNASNFLIVSLAVSDLLVGVLVMPYAFYVELSDANK